METRYLFLNEIGNYVIWRSPHPLVVNSLRRGLVNGRAASVNRNHVLYNENILREQFIFTLDNDNLKWSMAPRSTLSIDVLNTIKKWRIIAKYQENLYSYLEMALFDNKFFPDNYELYNIQRIVDRPDLLEKYAAGRMLSTEQCKAELNLYIQNYELCTAYHFGIYTKYTNLVNDAQSETLEAIPSALNTVLGNAWAEIIGSRN
jgi:hypothetical protein